MIIIGNEHILHNKFINITSIKDISNTPSNCVIISTYDIELIKYCLKNNIKNAIIVNTIKESLFCNSLDVTYIIVKKDIANKIQNIAQNYMFDSKILQIIKDDNDIEELAINEIDGCIYESMIKA